ncbi:hypothetical protein WJX74_002692 [Apatococcus lobatus]|uniref:Uncharacterized protein n=1 Tax=Apatococcus lobatus TaxID=904363 RepID=A0AAW1QJB8_9CHLO
MALQSRPSNSRQRRNSLGPKPSRFFLLTACLLLVGLTLALCARHTIGLGNVQHLGIDDSHQLPGELPGVHISRHRALADEGSSFGESELEGSELGGRMFGSNQQNMLVLGQELSTPYRSDSAVTKPTAVSESTSTKSEPKTQMLSQTVTLPGDDTADESSATSKPTFFSETTAQSDSSRTQPLSQQQTATQPADTLSSAKSSSEAHQEEPGATDMSLSLGTQDDLDQASAAAEDDFAASELYDTDDNELPSMESGTAGSREIDVRSALSKPNDGTMGETFSVDETEVEDKDYEQPRSGALPGAAEAIATQVEADEEATGDPRLQSQAGTSEVAEPKPIVTTADIQEVPAVQRETKVEALPTLPQPAIQIASTTGTPGTAVLFMMTGTAKEDLDSLRFFVRNGMSDPAATFLAAVPNPASADLPALPAQASYIQLPGKQCLWGMIGELLDGAAAFLLGAENAVIIGSDLRGPFLPGYYPASWSQAFTSRLSARVKLVGPIMSCFPVAGTEALRAELAAPTGSLPFLHPSMFATDQDGLKLLKDNSVFSCPGAGVDSIRYPSAKATSVMLGAGLSLDTLMLRYQGVNWRDPQHWDCNGQAEPTFMHSYDGEHLNPLEVMFAPVDHQRLYSGHPTARLAKRYDRWQQELGKPNAQVSSNMYTMDPVTFRSQRMAYMQSRGPGCFDKAYYQSHSPDLQGMGAADLWEHFWKNGQFEGREYRFSCVDLKARGAGCFDGWFYITKNIDLNELRLAGNPLTPEQSWHHFVTDGLFTGRHYKFNPMCGEDLDSPNSVDYSSN